MTIVRLATVVAAAVVLSACVASEAPSEPGVGMFGTGVHGGDTAGR